MQAPSAGNQQPWRFSVVRDKTKLEELSHISPYSQFVGGANVGIVISIAKEGLRFPELAPIDAAIAAENILLEAVELGFGGTYLAVYPDLQRIQNVIRILGISEEPILLLSLGYPADSHKVNLRFDEEKVTYI